MKNTLTKSETRNLRNYTRVLRNLTKCVTFRPDGRIRRTPELNAALHAVVLADDKFMTPPDKWGDFHCVRDEVWFKYCAILSRFAKKSPVNARLVNLIENDIYIHRRALRAAYDLAHACK